MEMEHKTCQSCESWKRQNPENFDLGACIRLGVIVYGEKVSLSISTLGNKPTSDFAAVRTRREFGCIFHSDHLRLLGR
jgi:hypothetical protein